MTTYVKQGKIKKNNFTIVPNSIAQSRRLSLKARGLMMLCLSLPNDWKYSIEGLVKIIETDGKSSVKTALKELEREGYLERKKLHNKDGKFIGIEYILNDEPSVDLSSAEKPLAENRLTAESQQNQPLAEKPSVVKPPVENRTQQNTNYTNNNIYIIPTLQRIRKYIDKNSLAYVNADEFFYYYQQRDWRTNGGEKITNWQSLIQNWNKRAKAVYDERQRTLEKTAERHGYCIADNKLQSEPLKADVANAATITDFADLMKSNGKKSNIANFISRLAKEKEMKQNV